MAITFGQGLIVISTRWTSLKGVVAVKGLLLQHDEEDGLYAIFALDGSIVYTTNIWKQGFQPSSDYSQEQNDADKADFEANYKSGANRPLVAMDGGIPTQVPLPRTGSEAIFVTHNFCDSTTWYTESARASDEALTDSGGGLTWNSAHTSWIDMTHGKVFSEDSVADLAEHKYAVVVKADGVTMTQRTSFSASGGDYDVDYGSGTVTFFSSQSGKAVTASYSYADGSGWILKPNDGYQIDLEAAEAQFSEDTEYNDVLHFEIWGYDPGDPPNKIQYGDSQYKRFINIVDEALGSFPVVPPIGGLRGTPKAIYGFPFRYGTIRQLKSSQGLELRVHLLNNIRFGGEHTTGSFYCTVKAEGS